MTTETSSLGSRFRLLQKDGSSVKPPPHVEPQFEAAEIKSVFEEARKSAAECLKQMNDVLNLRSEKVG
ncbi:MAG: hypothetical protein ABJZ55_10215 [Fuerstiella sp.]